MGKRFEYDEIAEDVFGPIFDIIADDIIGKTRITTGTLLDIGCGGGHMSYALIRKGNYAHIHLLDINQYALDAARERAIALGYSSKISFTLGNVEDIPFKDNLFDLVISRGSMPFWDNQIRAFSEIYRVLRPEGQAYIGGGFGNREQRDRINRIFANNDRGFKPFDKKRSKTLPDEDYEELFKKWDCEHEIINDTDKGHWFVFKKAQNDR